MWRLLRTIYLFEKFSKAFILLDNRWYFGQRVTRELDHSVCSPFTVWYIDIPLVSLTDVSVRCCYTGRSKMAHTSFVVQGVDVIIYKRKGRM